MLIKFQDTDQFALTSKLLAVTYYVERVRSNWIMD